MIRKARIPANDMGAQRILNAALFIIRDCGPITASHGFKARLLQICNPTGSRFLLRHGVIRHCHIGQDQAIFGSVSVSNLFDRLYCKARVSSPERPRPSLRQFPSNP